VVALDLLVGVMNLSLGLRNRSLLLLGNLPAALLVAIAAQIARGRIVAWNKAWDAYVLSLPNPHTAITRKVQLDPRARTRKVEIDPKAQDPGEPTRKVRIS